MKDTNETLEKLLQALGMQRGVCRPIDMLGRIVIPKEYRSQLNWNVGDALEVKLYDGAILIVKTTQSESLAIT